MKKLLLLIIAVITMTYSFAADSSASFTTAGNSSLPKTVDKITIKPAQGTGSKPGGSNANQYRLFSGNTLTISAAEGYVITGISSTASSSGYQLSSTRATCEQGTVRDNVVTISSPVQSVVLNFTGEVRFKTIIVSYKEGTSGPAKTSVTLTWSKNSETINVGETFEAPTLSVAPAAAVSSVSYSSSNPELLNVEENGTMTLTSGVVGTAKITAAISENDETYSATSAVYTLEVVDPTEVKYEDLMTSSTFNMSGSSYEKYSYTSTNTGVTYEMKASLSNGIQINTPGTKAGPKNSGIVSTENSQGLLIKKIVLKSANNKLVVTVSNTPGSVTSDGTNVTVSGPTDGTSITETKQSDGSYTYIPTTDAKFLYISSTGADQISQFDVYYSKAGDPTKGNVEITFDGGDMTEAFEAGKQVQGRVATASVEGLEISYSSSNEAVATVDAATGMLTLVAPGTTTITAGTKATEEYNAGSASYQLTVEITYNSIDDVLKLAKNNDVVDLNFAMTVGYVNGKNVYVTDGKGGYILIYVDGETSYTASDIIPAGMSATYTIYNGLPELKPQTQPEATEKGTYEIETVAATEVMSQPLSKIVMVEGVSFAEATPATNASFTGVADETSLNFYNSLKLASVESGQYDVNVAVSTHINKATEISEPSQLIPLEYVALPAIAAITIGGEPVTESYELKGEEVTVILTAAKGESIWYKFTETKSTPEATQAEEGFKAYPTEGIKIGGLGLLEYYSELNGRQSAVTRIEFKGIPTSISEITAEDKVAEYYDLSGRRVSAPTKGIVIKKTGSKVSKVVF